MKVCEFVKSDSASFQTTKNIISSNAAVQRLVTGKKIQK